MIVSINQPAYLPWPGYFHRIAASDLHIVLDHVQFEKNSFTNRNKVRTKEGWCWLTVPLKTKGRFGDLAINRVEISNETHWRYKHWMTLCLNYSKAPYWKQHSEFLESVYAREWIYLIDLVKDINNYLLSAFKISTPLLYSSSMSAEGRKAELVVNLCKAAGADTYFSGPLGRHYLQGKLFEEAGIKIEYDDYNQPSYTQAHPGFHPLMAAIDLLLNHGPSSRDVLMNRQRRTSV